MRSRILKITIFSVLLCGVLKAERSYALASCDALLARMDLICKRFPGSPPCDNATKLYNQCLSNDPNNSDNVNNGGGKGKGGKCNKNKPGKNTKSFRKNSKNKNNKCGKGKGNKGNKGKGNKK